MSLSGVDISYAQGTTPSLTGLSFVFCRASYGGGGTDTKWAYHSANVRAAGKVLGAYHFWYDGTSGAAQAAHFLSIAGSADLCVLDFEGAAKDITGAKAFIAAVKATGRKCGLYHSLSGFPSWGQDFNWVAYWGTPAPAIPWAFWQWTDIPLDRDYFVGDATGLATLVGGSQGGVNIPEAIDVIHAKSEASLGTFTLGAGHSLIDVADPSRRYPKPSGSSYAVAAKLRLVDDAGKAIDIDGAQPPVAGRDQVYLVDDPAFGAAAFALQGDGTFTPPPGYTQADLDAAKLAGQRFEFDREFGTSTTAGVAKITPAPRP